MDKKLPAFLSVGQTAHRSGVAVSTLHFYETKGLINSVRTEGNQRRYERNILRRIALIKTAQKLGISLLEIIKLLEPFPPNKKLSAEDVRRMVSVWKEMLEDRIKKLSRLKKYTDKCIGCGCLSQAECPLMNHHDHLSTKGSGAIILNE